MSDPIKRTYLPTIVKYRLTQLVEAEYPTAEKTDREFAAMAAERLSCAEINANHVFGVRQALGLAAYQTARVAVTIEALVALEARLKAVEAQLLVMSVRLGKLGV